MEDSRASSGPSMRPVPAEGEDYLHGETMVVNMGPSHPSTHGVLRLGLTLDGEVVKAGQPHVGYLHRGLEKIAEGMAYNQVVPYTHRLHHPAPPAQHRGFIPGGREPRRITRPA